MMKRKNRMLAGDACTVEGYDGMMRFWVSGSYSYVPDDAEWKADAHRMMVERLEDGSALVCAQSLIPWDTPDDKILELQDAALNAMDTALGIPSDCLTSSSWNAGHNDRRWDSLLSADERALLQRGEPV